MLLAIYSIFEGKIFLEMDEYFVLKFGEVFDISKLTAF